MSLKYQTVKQTPGKADTVLGDIFNAYVRVHRGDIETTTVITKNNDGYITSMEVSGDIEYRVEYTYDSNYNITRIDYYVKEYIYKEHLTSNENYTVYSSRIQNWDSDYTPTVYKNGNIISSGFTINYTNGAVEFTSGQSSTDDIQCSYRHIIHFKDEYSYGTNTITITRSIL